MPLLFTELLAPLWFAAGPASSVPLWLLSKLIMKCFMPSYLQGCPGAEAKWGIAPGPGPRSPGRMGAAVQIQEEGIAPFKTSPDVSC